MDDLFSEIIKCSEACGNQDSRIGTSREGRPIHGYSIGEGPVQVSLLGGCHADEPVGPRLLRRLVSFLQAQPPESPLRRRYCWWVIPHINPDGEERNRRWFDRGGVRRDDGDGIDLVEYLEFVIRERPGDDIEFGFPRDEKDGEARPENRAAWNFWKQAKRPFSLHGSLHGMGFAAGPWFLIEPAYRGRMKVLQDRCETAVSSLGYRLHDVERNGEKGFSRIARGFCTRPDSREMARFFLERREPEVARLFRPSSMETIRSLGGDPLTLVSEMPFFILPGVGEDLGPPDLRAEEWKERIEHWRLKLASGAPRSEIRTEASVEGLGAMPILDQMDLQWTFIAAGLAQVSSSCRDS